MNSPDKKSPGIHMEFGALFVNQPALRGGRKAQLLAEGGFEGRLIDEQSPEFHVNPGACLIG